MGILDFIFPKKCLECGKEGKYICEKCLGKVTPAGWNSKWSFSFWRYEAVIRKAIIALKYKYSTEIAKELAEICVQELKHSSKFLIPTSGLLLAPIPLHWYRQNFRGFNQSEEIGKLIAEKMRWKFIPDLLIKTKSTHPQVQLKGAGRRKNVKGAFAVNPHYALSTLYSVLIFDDVLTTGSTLMEAARVLKKAGVSKVWGLTIAR